MSAARRGESVVERHYPLFMLAGLGASALLHGVAYASLAAAPRQQAGAPMTSEVAFEVAPLPPPPEVAPAPEPPARSEPEPARAAPRPAPQRAEPPPPETTAQRAQSAVDLSGVTLTNDSGEAGWSSVVGNGSALRGPQGPVRPSGPVVAVASAREPSAPKQAPSLVAAADLSERPRPPGLDGVLKRNYPEDARSRGISGTASVRARIGADGRVSHTRVLSESFSGFGEACKRTLAGSRWSPPKNREGSAVATEIAYTCRFVVDR
jgi:periplasmic protein TonB